MGVLCPPKGTGMKVKADGSQRCLGIEPVIEDAPAPGRFPALPGHSSSSPRARLPGCAGVWLGPRARLGGSCSSLLAFLSSVGRCGGAYPVTPVETCFRDQTPGSGLFWRPTFPQRSIFPRPKNYGGLRVSCLWPGPLGEHSSRAELGPDDPSASSAQHRAWPKGLLATVEILNLCPNTQAASSAKIGDSYTSHSGPRDAEGLKPLGLSAFYRSPHDPAPRAEVPEVCALHRGAPEVCGRRQLQVSAHPPLALVGTSESLSTGPTEGHRSSTRTPAHRGTSLSCDLRPHRACGSADCVSPPPPPASAPGPRAPWL